MQHQTEPISSESARGCPSHRLSRAWVHCPRAPEQFVASPLGLVGYVRWDARSVRVPPLQTIIFSSFTGRTPSCRQTGNNELLVAPPVIRSAHPRIADGIQPAARSISPIRGDLHWPVLTYCRWQRSVFILNPDQFHRQII